MRTERRLRLSRFFLGLVLFALGGAALFGIATLLSGEFDEFEGRVLLTCLSVGGASLAALTCAVPLEHERGKLVPICGITVVHVAFAFVVGGLWTDLFREDEYARATGVVSIAAASLTHWNLVSLPRLPRSAWWLFPALVAFNLALALLLSAGLLEIIDLGDAWWRVIGIFSILLAFGTIAVPITQRLGRRSAAEMASLPRPEEIEVYCPRCHRRQKILLGSSDCSHCGLEIRVELGDWHEPAPNASAADTTSESSPASGEGRESQERDSRC